MKKVLRSIILCCLILCMLPLTGVRSEQSDEQVYIHVRAASSMLGLLRTSAEQYMVEHPGTVISVTGSQSGSFRGVKSVIEGTADIGGSSSEPDEVHQKMMDKRDVEVVGHVVKNDAVVPIVHPDNPVSALGLKQLKQIFVGEITNWKEVGGKDLPIVVISQLGNTGAYETWSKVVLERTAMVTSEAIFLDTASMIKMVENNEDVIAYAGFTNIVNNPALRMLEVEGVAATEDSIRKATFQIKRSLSLYTRSDASDEVQDFVEYVQAQAQ